MANKVLETAGKSALEAVCDEDSDKIDCLCFYSKDRHHINVVSQQLFFILLIHGLPTSLYNLLYIFKGVTNISI